MDKILKDLEIYEKIFPLINHTITSYGTSNLKLMLKIFYNNQDKLLRRQEIIQLINEFPLERKRIITSLKKIKKYEDDISWLFSSKSSSENDLYFSHQTLNIQGLLSLKNNLKIYTPSIVIIVYLFIYAILRYNGINLSVYNYFRGLYIGYQSMITGLLCLLMHNENLVSVFANFLTTTYALYCVYSSYNSLDSSMCHYRTCKDFSTRIYNIRRLIDECLSIFKYDRFMIDEKQSVLDSLNDLDELFNPKKILSFGYELVLKNKIEDHKANMIIVLNYIGKLDAYINISKLLFYGYSLPNFDFKINEGPYIDARGLWYPCFNFYDQMKNDCLLHKPGTMIITGPNTSGKSTYIKNVMLSIYLSQTIGVTCCLNLQFTPFHEIFTYIDIPNIIRDKESLFEAELNRCLDYCKKIENINDNKYVLAVMDELFTSTNIKEAVPIAYSTCEYIGKFNQALTIITTHFEELSKLESENPNKFKNMRFTIYKRENGSFYRSYEIEDGASNQHIAIELLKEKGYNNMIVENALNKITHQ